SPRRPPPAVSRLFPTRRSSDLLVGSRSAPELRRVGERVELPVPPVEAGLAELRRGPREPLVHRAEVPGGVAHVLVAAEQVGPPRSEEHTSELQSLTNLVCRLLH